MLFRDLDPLMSFSFQDLFLSRTLRVFKSKAGLELRRRRSLASGRSARPPCAGGRYALTTLCDGEWRKWPPASDMFDESVQVRGW
jgi:hypothetical protein